MRTRGKMICTAAIMTVSLTAMAHYHIIAPSSYNKWQARKGETVPMNLIWGHGYEHNWFDIASPVSFVAIAPDGDRSDLMPALKPIKVKSASGKEFAAYAFDFTPSARGDYLFALDAGWQWDEQESAWLKDFAKAILHVQSESDWGRVVGQPLEIVPLSRPYGVLPGDALVFRVLLEGKPAAGVRVERELFTEKAPSPESLPPEEFIAYPAVTDDAGEVTFSFPVPGWHGVTAMTETDRVREADGHKGGVIRRCTFWVYVSAKAD